MEHAQGYPEWQEKARGGLKVWVLEKIQRWVNGLLEGELTEHLGRARYERSEQPGENSRNGHRPRRLNLWGLGPVPLAVPRDRAGTFQSQVLPARRGQDEALEALVAECFLAGLSTRDLARITEKHLGKRYDSKQVSRLVERASQELEVWQRRSLADRAYKMLFVDGTNIQVRIKGRVERLAFCVVLGLSETAQVLEVLGVMMGDREQVALWEQLFQDLADRGLAMEAVELGIMDGLPGLETAFTRAFPRAQTQRCQKHAAGNALRRVAKADRETFHRELNQIFYGPSEAEARKAFHTLKAQWGRTYPGAVSVIERDLDALVRFFQFDATYWASIRTTNPIERLNKEIKRRTNAMEVTGGESSTYRVITYVAMTMEYQWRFHPVTQWAHVYQSYSRLYTQNAA